MNSQADIIQAVARSDQLIQEALEKGSPELELFLEDDSPELSRHPLAKALVRSILQRHKAIQALEEKE